MIAVFGCFGGPLKFFFTKLNKRRSSTRRHSTGTIKPTRDSSPEGSRLNEFQLPVPQNCPENFGLEISGGSSGNNVIFVGDIQDESPFRYRIFKGDFLWAINDVTVQGLDHDKVIDLLTKAASGSAVSLTVLPYHGRPLEASIAELQGALRTHQVARWYDMVPRHQKHLTYKASMLEENASKNRYTDIVTFDATRVLLTPNEHNGHSDYINANHVKMERLDASLQHTYIATQGPKASTVNDFWQMVIQQNSHLIAMLTTLIDGKIVKCDLYWPNLGTQMNLFDGWTVTHVSETSNKSWITRNFLLQNKQSGEKRKIIHLQYVRWPDHGVPSRPEDFTAFAHEVREYRKINSLAPVIVHCSAGIGRTGVLIMMETAMVMIEKGQALDLLDMLRVMREQRYGLVQTKDQLVFVAGAILRAFLSGEVSPLEN